MRQIFYSKQFKCDRQYFNKAQQLKDGMCQKYIQISVIFIQSILFAVSNIPLLSKRSLKNAAVCWVPNISTCSKKKQIVTIYYWPIINPWYNSVMIYTSGLLRSSINIIIFFPFLGLSVYGVNCSSFDCMKFCRFGAVVWQDSVNV